MTTLGKTFWTLFGVAAVLRLAAGPAEGQAPAGTAAAVNPQVTGAPPALPSRILEVGADLVENEHVTTDPEGQAQLLFRDGSTVTLGPGSDLTIDRFVYDSASKTATLAMTATRGILRLVGGRASKDEPITIKTPNAILGVRGGINFTRIAANGDTETTQAYGRDTTATSKSTGERRVLARNGFTVIIKSNQRITISRTDPGRLAAMLAAMDGRPGASGGATSVPDQGAPGARNVASINSSQPALGLAPGALTSRPTLGAVASYTTQLVSGTAQTAATGVALGSAGVATGFTQLPSGNYVGGFVSGLFNGGDTGGGLDFGGSAYGPYSYTRTTIATGDVTTFSEGATNQLILMRGIPQSLTGLESRDQTSMGSTTSTLDRLDATIRNTTVLELGGDNLIQFGRLTGGSGSFGEVFTSTDPANPSFSSGPFSASLANRSSHYVIGVPATLLPSAGTFSYSLLGATSPTFADGSGAPGKFTGSLNIMFGVNPALFLGSQSGTYSFSGNVSGMLVALDATVTMPNDASYRMVTLGGLSNPSAQLAVIRNPDDNFQGAVFGFIAQRAGFAGSPNVLLSGPARACPQPSSCGAVVGGFLAGPGGKRVGLLYTIGNNVGLLGSVAQVNLAQAIIGAAAFRR